MYALEYACCVRQSYVRLIGQNVELDLKESQEVIHNLHPLVRLPLLNHQCLLHHLQIRVLVSLESVRVVLEPLDKSDLLSQSQEVPPSLQEFLERFHLVNSLLGFHLHNLQRMHLSFDLIENVVFLFPFSPLILNLTL